MRGRMNMRAAVASVSIAAALASPTFGVNLSFNAGQSSVIYLHDAEDGDAGGASPTHFRSQTVPGSQLPFGSAPGYQLGSAFVDQFGGSGTGDSQGRIGIGHVEDIRTATMTVQSLTLVTQNERATDPAQKMDGNSLVRANFTMVWDATGTYGPNLVGRVSVPIKASIVGGGSAAVRLDDVNWEVDLAGDAAGFFDARPAFTGEKAFNSPGTFSTILSSNSVLLKNQAGANLTLNAGDQFRLTGTLTFLANGNSPADTQFQFSDDQYSDVVLPNNPLRYYRLNESATDLPPLVIGETRAAALDGLPAFDFGSEGLDGRYTGNVEPEARTANFTLGTAARFPVDVFQVEPNNQVSLMAAPAVSGIGDVIIAPHSEAINFGNPGGGGPFTVEAWVSREDFIGFASDPDPVFASLVDKQDADGNGWRLGINNNALLLDGGVGGTDAVLPFPNPDESFRLDEFYHVVAVVAGDGSVKFYVNGVSLSTDATPYSLLTNSMEDLFIGNSLSGFNPFPGIIDEVAIYGQILSEEDIIRHFERGRENSEFLPIMGIEIDAGFIEVPEPTTVVLGVIAVAAGTVIVGRRRRKGHA